MATILDVAKEADVSPSTVSRALNNSGTISPATVKKVYQAVEKLGYEPNVFARSLRRKETRIILILTPNITNSYYAHIISGISDFSREMSYSSFICSTGNDSYQLKELLEKFSRHQADGAILMSVEKGEKWLRDFSNDFPIIQVSEFDPKIPIPHVCVDNYQAAYDAVTYLISLGHRKIAIISSVNRFISTEMRMKGYLDALKDAGIEVRDSYIAYASADYSYHSGCNETRKLLTLRDRPTAIFSISDIVAFGAVNTAKELGLSIPSEISIIGFDDVEQTTMFTPRITTVAQPCFTIGHRAAELLYRAINQESSIPLETILPYELMVRETTAPPLS